LDPAVLFVHRVPGISWREMIFEGEDSLISSSRAAAGWLSMLHGKDLKLRRGTHLMVFSRLRRIEKEISQLFPDQADRVGAIVKKINASVLYSGVIKPSHGDFHARHMYMAREAVTAIDLDSLALREPAFDVGYAIGHLLMMAWLKYGTYDRGTKSSALFLEEYLRHEQVETGRLVLHIARALLQSAHYSIVMRNPSIGPVERWLDVVERFLESRDRIPILETPL
jgi:hypothetical protein